MNISACKLCSFEKVERASLATNRSTAGSLLAVLESRNIQHGQRELTEYRGVDCDAAFATLFRRPWRRVVEATLLFSSRWITCFIFVWINVSSPLTLTHTAERGLAPTRELTKRDHTCIRHSEIFLHGRFVFSAVVYPQTVTVGGNEQ